MNVLEPTASLPSGGPARRTRVSVVGGGPAGLMAAEALAQNGFDVDLFDAMPSVGRKFLLAGRGGLNLTHSEPYERFVRRFGSRAARMQSMLDAFRPDDLREWVHGLGIDTFVGSSGRVFPTDMKAAPLLRAWLQRLRKSGVRFHMRHRWTGFRERESSMSQRTSSPITLELDTPNGAVAWETDAVVLAMGGASWPRLGSDGAWVPALERCGVEVAPLKPANCGFDVEGWSPFLVERFAGQPFKSVALEVLASADAGAPVFRRRGEFVATATGIEGSLVYAASASLRDAIEAEGKATVWIDLLPDRSQQQVAEAVNHPRGARSLSSHLKSRLGIDGLKAAVLHEVLGADGMHDPSRLSSAIKRLPLRLISTRPIAEAISTAGGVRFEGLDDALMSGAMEGVFVAGEMLDWEAPTGGYLLNASMASGRQASEGVARFLSATRDQRAVALRTSPAQRS